MKWRGLFIVLASGVVIASMPAAAGAGAGPATQTVKGKTSQNTPAYARIRDDNSVARVGVRYIADCRKPRHTVRGGIYWQDRADSRGFERSGERFSDGGRHRGRIGRLRGVFDSRMTGAPLPNGGWAGKFRVTVRVKNRRGKTIDTCRTGLRSWRVAGTT
jgi:hypothetical protein